MNLKIALFLVMAFPVAAQTPQVPHKMSFAGMTLSIRDDARREMQKDVDALTQSPKHFAIKAERAKTYFPIIERIFKEENLPDDFKFLVLQESALIPDAVSVSNAVGFWQFKDFTAVEMGLRVDNVVDERMNIASSTRAAARYMKKNNSFFNNWLYALQAYQMGAGGVMRSVEDSEGGTKHMEITSATYWYVKKFLAHKIAFEDAVKGAGKTEVTLYDNKAKKSLGEIARAVTVNEDDLKSFNKWLKAETIPDDKLYAVIVPVRGASQLTDAPVVVASTTASLPETTSAKELPQRSNHKDERVKINGIEAIKAWPGETTDLLAARAGIELSYFLTCNDMPIGNTLIAGKYYFLSKKRVRAWEAYHKVSAGENLWTISQEYGVQLKRLERYNRIESGTPLSEGTTLWLSALKPKDSKTPPELEAKEVDQGQTFNWSVGTEGTSMTSTNKNTNKQRPRIDSTIRQENPDQDITKLPVQPSINVGSDSTKQFTSLPQEHVVQAGETLYSVSKRYNIDVAELLNWNNIKPEDGLKTGQILVLSGEKIMELRVLSNEMVHEVKPTDTLYSIARRYGVTIKELMDWNGKEDFNLVAGEKLRILQK